MPILKTYSEATDEKDAITLDQTDALKDFKSRFYLHADEIYMDGNSLGLMSKDAEASINRITDEWKHLAIKGWLNAKEPWFTLSEKLSLDLSKIVGATPFEVITYGSTTLNILLLLATFYKPDKNRFKILMDNLTFPSDRYAIESFLKLMGKDPAKTLKIIPSVNETLLDESAIINEMTQDIALIFLPSVLYRSGQLLDMEKLTEEAHKRDILIGFDCAHSVGVIPHELSRSKVDFACWCTYKYLNGGPGAVAGLYVHKTHISKGPGLQGWWGYKKERQFDMLNEFIPAESAGAWQIGTPNLLSMAPLEGAFKLINEAGIKTIREKSLKLTDYLIFLTENLLANEGFSIRTPKEKKRRGGHVALSHPEAIRINEALIQKKIIPDFRYPDIIRLAPSPLYTGFHDVWQVITTLKDIMVNKTYQNFEKKRKPVA